MATATLTLDKTAYSKGDKITATYTVVGADPITSTLTGSVVVDGVSLPESATITIQHAVVYAAPIGAGLTFAATADPHVWTATA